MKISRYVMPLVLLLAAALAANAQTAKFSNYNVSEGNVNVGSNNQKSISLTNTSRTTTLLISSLTISSTASPSPFTIGGGCTTASKLFPRSSCNLNINFVPTAAGIFHGTVTLISNDPVNPTQTVNVTGTGIWATLNPSSLSFGSVNIGKSYTLNAQLKNAASTAMTINSITASGAPFTITNTNCLASLGSGSKCYIAVTFKPTAAGLVTGTLTVMDDAGTQTTSLSGTGVAVLQSITVTPANATLAVPATQQYAATGTYNDGSQKDISASVLWASSNAAAATISSTGFVTTVAAGSTTITATSGTIPGSTGLTVTAAAKTLQSVTVTPANTSLVAPTTQQYTATANYSDLSSTDVTASASFSVLNTPPATASITTGGLLTTGVAGSSTVYASYNNVTGQTGVTVTHTQTGIVVSPPSATLNTGDSQQFVAYPTYSDSTTGTTPVAATWASSAPTTAQVDANGLTVGDAGGTVAISATTGQYVGNAAVTVNGANACTTNNRIDAKLLVLTNGKTEADFPAITTTLNYLHMPYDVVDRNAGVTQGQLYSGCHASYNGVIVAFLNGSAYNPTSTPPTLPFVGYDVLQTFEQTFGIRQLNWYAYPAPSIGFNWSTLNNGGNTAIPASFVGASSSVFPYVNLASGLTIDSHAYTYLAPALNGTALLADANGDALTLDYNFGDGREYVSNTFDSNQYMRHNIVLSYGLVNWVTKGMFVGEKHVFFTPQEDDWGIDDDIWASNDGSYLTIQGVTPPAVGSYPTCTNPSSTVTGMAYRISAADADAFVNWQTNKQSNPLFTGFHLYNAFNSCGLGVTDSLCGSNGSPYSPDTLTAWTKLKSNSDHFGWINHTYEHEDLTLEDDGKTFQPYSVDYFQINQNILNEQSSLLFTEFSPSYMVTPDISGLDYLPALQAMVDNGVQYVVSDTSCGKEKSTTSTCFTGTNNGPGPGFNLPIVNSNNPIVGSINTGNIYEVPRRPSNLFYNVGTPGGWQSEYDCIYTNLGGTDPNGKAYGTYTTQDIVDFIAGKKGVYPNFVDLMMQGDADPEMFHQTNLKAYNGTNSVLSDLLDESFNLYQSYFNLPVRSMAMDQLGQFMLNNLAVDKSGVVATVNNGSTHSVTLTVTNAATIPVTGLPSAGAEQYGSQVISHVPMTAGETLTQPAQ